MSTKENKARAGYIRATEPIDERDFPKTARGWLVRVSARGHSTRDGDNKNGRKGQDPQWDFLFKMRKNGPTVRRKLAKITPIETAFPDIQDTFSEKGPHTY